MSIERDVPNKPVDSTFYIRFLRNGVNNRIHGATACRHLFTAKLLYMFRAYIAPIIRNTKNCSCSLWYRSYYLGASFFKHDQIRTGWDSLCEVLINTSNVTKYGLIETVGVKYWSILQTWPNKDWLRESVWSIDQYFKRDQIRTDWDSRCEVLINTSNVTK